MKWGLAKGAALSLAIGSGCAASAGPAATPSLAAPPPRARDASSNATSDSSAPNGAPRTRDAAPPAPACPISIAADPRLETPSGNDRPFTLGLPDGGEMELRPRDAVPDLGTLLSSVQLYEATGRAHDWRLQETARVDLQGGNIVVALLTWAGEGVAAVVLSQVANAYCFVNTWELLPSGNGAEIALAAIHVLPDRASAILVLESSQAFSHGHSFTPNYDVLVALLVSRDRVRLALDEEAGEDTPRATWKVPVEVSDGDRGTTLLVGQGKNGRRFRLQPGTMQFKEEKGGR